MSGHTATLSDDRLTLTICIREATADRVLELGRPAGNPFTEEDVASAVRMAHEMPRRPLVIGQSNTTRRWRLLGGWWLYVDFMSGPPTWWHPRVFVRQRVLVFGWLRRGWAVGLRRSYS